MSFANPLPWWALLAVVVAAALLSWLAYRSARIPVRRRAVLATLRFVTMLVLALLLMRPVARTGDGGASGAIVPILVDVSRSMGIEDVDGMRRIDRARDIVSTALLPALSGQFRTEVLGFGAGVAPLAPEALTAAASRSDLDGSARRDLRALSRQNRRRHHRAVRRRRHEPGRACRARAGGCAGVRARARDGHRRSRP